MNELLINQTSLIIIHLFYLLFNGKFKSITVQTTAITGANTQFGYLHHQLIYPNKLHPQF